MKTNLVRALALLAVIGVGACGDDTPTSTGDALSEAEAAALSEIVLGTAFQATAGGIPVAPAAVDGPQAVPFSYSADVDVTSACSGGGTASLSGSATINGDDETGEFSITYNVTASYDECSEFAGEQEQQFTVGGSLTMTANADYDAGQGETFGTLTSTGSFNGSISWSSDDGRSGTCAVALTSSVTSNGESINASTEGTFCGASINETFTYGVQG